MSYFAIKALLAWPLVSVITAVIFSKVAAFNDEEDTK